MNSPSPPFAYQVGFKYRIGGNRYRLAHRDVQALLALRRIRRGRPEEPTNCWLLAYRAQIRAIVNRRPRAALTLLALTSRDRLTRRLALWLRGMCGGTLGAPHLLAAAKRADGETQAQVARALQGMGAWAQLREFAQLEPVRSVAGRFLRQPTPRRFSDRMDRFLAHVPRLERSSNPCPLFCADGTSDSKGRPAKPVWLIRLVLDRIRFLVSAEHSPDRMPKQLHEDTS